jgi:hypothetical protein
MMAFLHGLIGLVVMGGNKSVPLLIQNAAKTAALWAARGFIAWSERTEKTKDAPKDDDRASNEAFDKRYSMGTLVRVVNGPNTGAVGRVRWDNVHTDAQNVSTRRITIMVGDGRGTRAIIEEPGNVVAEPEKSPVADPVGGGGSGSGAVDVVAKELPSFHEMIKAAIHAAWNVDLSKQAPEEEVLAIIFAGPEGSDGDVAECAAEIQRLIELDPYKMAYESGHTLKCTFGKRIRRHDGRHVCIRVATPSMGESLIRAHSLVFFGFTDAALSTFGENTPALFSLLVQECRQRLIGPDGVEWGKKVDPEEQAISVDDDASSPAPQDVGASSQKTGDKELEVDEYVRVASDHPAHANKRGKIVRFEDYREKVVVDFSHGGPMQVATIEIQHLSRAPAPVAGGSLRRPIETDEGGSPLRRRRLGRTA